MQPLPVAKHKVSSVLNKSAEFASKVRLYDRMYNYNHYIIFLVGKLLILLHFPFANIGCEYDCDSMIPQHMFDGNEDTCWNSHQGSPQSILMECKDSVVPVSITAVFQGGFVGQDATIELLSGDSADRVETVHTELWDTLEGI